VLDPGVTADAAGAAVDEATMTDAQRRIGLWLGIWLIVATLLLLVVVGVVGIMPLVRIAEELLS